jgi:Mg-chelatase subunit ChlD
MSKHTTKEENANYLINAITKTDGKILVQKIDNDGNVIFKSDDNTVSFFQKILNVPKRLSEYVYRAFTGKIQKTDKEEKNDDKVIETKGEIIELNDLKEISQEQEITNQVIKNEDKNELILLENKNPVDLKTITTIQDIEIFNKIFSPNFMVEFSLNDFKSSHFGCIEKKEESPSIFWAKRRESNYELVKLALSDPEQVAKILLSQSKLINSEGDVKTDDFSKFAENIFSVTRKGKEVTSVFNAAAFKQMLAIQMKSNLVDHSPLIAKIISGENLYSINLDHLKGFIGKQVAEIVFNPEKSIKDGELALRPVMLPSIQSTKINEKTSNKILVKLLLDISGSMQAYLKEYKQQVKDIVSDIVGSIDEWQIDLTTFETTSSTFKFNSKDHNIKSIEGFLDNLSTGDCTKLYSTMFSELNNINQSKEDYTYTAFIVFTDGEDNIGGNSIYDISNSALKIRENKNNLQMFSIELGKSNEKFFKDLSLKSGITHIQLANIDDLKTFKNYTDGLFKDSIVLKMLDESLKTWAQQVAVKGEITVSNLVISEKTILNFGGQEITISDPTEDFKDLIGNIDENGGIQ